MTPEENKWKNQNMKFSTGQLTQSLQQREKVN